MPYSEENFHKSLENDIEDLQEEIEKVKTSDDSEKFEKKEIIKKSFGSLASKKVSQKKVDFKKKKTKKQIKKSSRSDLLPSYMDKEDVDPEVRLAIEKLMDIVFHKGILAALKESKKYSPFIQDSFHDALAEKLVPLLEDKEIL